MRLTPLRQLTCHFTRKLIASNKAFPTDLHHRVVNRNFESVAHKKLLELEGIPQVRSHQLAQIGW